MKNEMESIHFQRQLQKAKKLSLESAKKERHATSTNLSPSEKDAKMPRTPSKDFGLCSPVKTTPLNTRSPVRRRSFASSSRQSRSSRRFLMTSTVAMNKSLTLPQPPSKESPSLVGLQKFVDVVLDGFHSELNVFDRIEIVTPDELVGAKGLAKEEAEKENTPKKSLSKRSQKSGEEPTVNSLGRLPQPSFRVVENYVPPSDMVSRPDGYYRYIEKTPDELEEEVEYEMDCEDLAWLELYNDQRRKSRHPPISDETFERLMDRLEKEAYVASQQQRPSSSDPAPDEDDIVCAICLDDDCQNSNVILFCDRCNLAVHQECYGVPYVPEGQWLCSPCQAAPSGPVSCVLCPVTGGAMKQTNHGKWSHILCALWIPEVGFGNIESLEPITKIEKVPPGRRRLTCSVCKQKDVGACIQCMKKNCFTAFHVTCAQQAGLYMTIEPTHNEDGSLSNVRKTILCDRHKPANARPFQPMYDSSGMDTEDDQPLVRSQTGNQRPQTQSRLPVQRLPVDAKPAATFNDDVELIPKERLVVIMESLKMKDRAAVLSAVQCYWCLKKRVRHGLPLLRRLQAASLLQNLGMSGDGSSESSLAGLRDLKKLRNDMEKVRLLLELIRKREKLKMEEVRLREKSFRLELEPLNVLLRKTLEQLQAKDRSSIFAFPVPLKELPDYASKISHPMDFSTMRSKIDRHAYVSLDDFVADFELIINNCTTYNARHSMYHKAALRFRQQAEEILAEAREEADAAGFCSASGLHASTVEAQRKRKEKKRTYDGSTEPNKPASVPALHEDRRSSDRIKMPTRRYLIDDDVVPVAQSTSRKRNLSTDSEEPPVLSRCPSPVDASAPSSLPAPVRKRSRHSSSHRDPPQLVKSAPCIPFAPVGLDSTVYNLELLSNSVDWEELIPVMSLATQKDEKTCFTVAVDPANPEGPARTTSLVPILPSQGSDLKVANSDLASRSASEPLRSTLADLLVAVLESDGSNSLPGTNNFPSGTYLESLERLKVDSAYGSASCSSSDSDNCDKH